MMLIDTHTHLYDSAFDNNRAEVAARAREAGVVTMLLPAIDSSTHEAMFELVREYGADTGSGSRSGVGSASGSLTGVGPGSGFEAGADSGSSGSFVAGSSAFGLFVPMMGLHPTSVDENWRRELALVEEFLATPPCRFCAVGEVGLDLHWSRDRFAEQVEVFERQIFLSIEYDLPLVIHTRDCWPEMIDILERHTVEADCGAASGQDADRDSGRTAGRLRGVMHAFSGSYDDYMAVKRCGDFLFGIGGPVTYKNSALTAILPRMSLDDIVLETDAPYLPPVPFRGRQNESAYLTYIADCVARLFGVSCEEAAAATSRNAMRMFGLV